MGEHGFGAWSSDAMLATVTSLEFGVGSRTRCDGGCDSFGHVEFVQTEIDSWFGLPTVEA